MDLQQLVKKIQGEFKDRILESDLDGKEPYIRVAPDEWPKLARFLKDRCGMNYLMCLTGIDRGKDAGLEAVYNVEQLSTQPASRVPRVGISIRVAVPYDHPHIPTVESVWRTADWHERECYDLMGIVFDGHHNLVRILCAEDWEGHPLRKDYKSPDYYHGIRNNVV